MPSSPVSPPSTGSVTTLGVAADSGLRHRSPSLRPFLSPFLTRRPDFHFPELPLTLPLLSLLPAPERCLPPFRIASSSIRLFCPAWDGALRRGRKTFSPFVLFSFTCLLPGYSPSLFLGMLPWLACVWAAFIPVFFCVPFFCFCLRLLPSFPSFSRHRLARWRGHFSFTL